MRKRQMVFRHADMFTCYRKMPVRHWAASHRPRVLTTGASFFAGPEASRSAMVVKSRVVTENTTPPDTARISGENVELYICGIM